MKIRNDYVTNSSSTSFAIYNKTDEDKTLADFIDEVPEIVKLWNDCIEEFHNDDYLKNVVNGEFVYKRIWTLVDLDEASDLSDIIEPHRIYIATASNDSLEDLRSFLFYVIGYQNSLSGETESFVYNGEDQ